MQGAVSSLNVSVATGVALFEAAHLRDAGWWARDHLNLIRRFGRFPHRNAVLGRPSTPDELAFLEYNGERYGQEPPAAGRRSRDRPLGDA